MNTPEELSKLVEELKMEINFIRGAGVTDARYLQVVNATSVPFTIGLFFVSYPEQTPNPLPIGNVAAKFTTLPIDLTNWFKTNRTCRLAIRRSGSAWVTFDGWFYFSDAANTTKAAFQVSSLGTWSCTGPNFGPIVATKSSAIKDDELADIPGDPLEL